MKTHLLWLAVGVGVGYLAVTTLNSKNPWQWAYMKGASIGG